jgi:hypothetical protein
MTLMKLHPVLLVALGAASAALLQAFEVPVGPPVFSNPLSITNPYQPFVPGRVKHFEVIQGHPDAEDVETYTAGTRNFSWNGALVACRVLQETSLEDGEIVEISRNYFAQADDGTVYYFGEVVDLYAGGIVVGHEGSWLVGGPTDPSDPPETAADTDPNVFMPADPESGDEYRPEDTLPVVDETDLILKSGQKINVPTGQYSQCIQVRETSVLTPDIETKWYAPDLGVVKVKEHGEVRVLDLVTGP